MNRRTKVLIGCCGGLTGFYVAKRLSRYYHLFGFDSSNDCATTKYIDSIDISPSLDDEEGFISFLIKLGNMKNINVYIPTYSKEVRLIAKNEQTIRSKCEMKFLVSDYATVIALEDKQNAYERLRSLGIDTPKMLHPDNEIVTFPIYAKPNVGSGSKSNFVIEDYEEWLRIRKKYSDLFTMEYLQGTEYTVDAFFCKNGSLHDYNQRQRVKTSGGAAVITKNDFSISVDQFIKTLGKNFSIVGPANFQFIHTSQGRNVFTDFNLRMASGGMPLSVESGLDIPEMVVRECLGKSIAQFRSDRKERTMYRYYEEYFV